MQPSVRRAILLSLTFPKNISRTISFYTAGFMYYRTSTIYFYHKEISEWMEIKDMSIFQTTFTPSLLSVMLANLLDNKSSILRNRP